MLRNAFIFVTVVFIGFALVLAMDYETSRSLKESVEGVIGESKVSEAPKDFEFSDLNGDIHKLSSFKGKVIVLNFWASWCPPCIKEFPDLIKLADEYADQIVLIAVSSDFEEKAMTRFLKKMRVDHPEIYPADNIFISLDDRGNITRNLFHIYKLPETLVIKPDFIIHKKIAGANWNYEDMKEIVGEALQ